MLVSGSINRDYSRYCTVLHTRSVLPNVVLPNVVLPNVVFYLITIGFVDSSFVHLFSFANLGTYIPFCVQSFLPLSSPSESWCYWSRDCRKLNPPSLYACWPASLLLLIFFLSLVLHRLVLVYLGTVLPNDTNIVASSDHR